MKVVKEIENTTNQPVLMVPCSDLLDQLEFLKSYHSGWSYQKYDALIFLVDSLRIWVHSHKQSVINAKEEGL